MRNVMTRVFPLPAPARINTGPSVVSTASRCCGFSWSRKDNAEVAPGSLSLILQGISGGRDCACQFQLADPRNETIPCVQAPGTANFGRKAGRDVRSFHRVEMGGSP